MARGRKLRPGAAVVLALAAGALAASVAADPEEARAPAPSRDPVALLRQARAHREGKRTWRAVVALRRAVQLRPAWGEAWGELAAALAENGEKALARVAACVARERTAGETPGRGQDAPGAPRELIAAYFGLAESDGACGWGSVGCGEPLAPELLVAVAFDDRGTAVPCPLEWSAEAGLVSSGVGAWRGGDRPGEGSLRVRIAGTGRAASVSIRVVGAPAAVRLEPARAEVHAGERVHVKAVVVDAAGEALWVPELKWELRSETAPAPATLRRDRSWVVAEDHFEPHRVVLDVVREGIEPGRAFGLAASVPGGHAQASALLEIVPGDPPAPSPTGGIAWLHSYEEALRQAREQDRPLFVEAMADW